MKHIIKSAFLLIGVALAWTPSLNAQDNAKELQEFAKKFEKAYNKKDDKALKNMFTTDAVRTTSDGSVINGNEAIRAVLVEYFKGNVTIAITQEKVATEADGSIVGYGTYHITGTTAAGETIDYSGGYANTVVKEKGHWKIAKQVLKEL